MKNHPPVEQHNAPSKIHLTLNDGQIRVKSALIDQIEEMPFWVIREDFETPKSKLKGILGVSEDYSLLEITAVISTETGYAFDNLFWSFLEEGIVTIIRNDNGTLRSYPNTSEFTHIDDNELYNCLFFSPIYVIQKKKL